MTFSPQWCEQRENLKQLILRDCLYFFLIILKWVGGVLPLQAGCFHTLRPHNCVQTVQSQWFLHNRCPLMSDEPLGCYTVSIYVYNQIKLSEVSRLLIFCVLDHRFIPHYLQNFLANQLNQMVLDSRAIKFSSKIPTLVWGSFFKEYFVQKWKLCTISSLPCPSVSFLCFEEEGWRKWFGILRGWVNNYNFYFQAREIQGEVRMKFSRVFMNLSQIFRAAMAETSLNAEVKNPISQTHGGRLNMKGIISLPWLMSLLRVLFLLN